MGKISNWSRLERKLVQARGYLQDLKMEVANSGEEIRGQVFKAAAAIGEAVRLSKNSE